VKAFSSAGSASLPPLSRLYIDAISSYNIFVEAALFNCVNPSNKSDLNFHIDLRLEMFDGI
jgi:hypothetical protein